MNMEKEMEPSVASKMSKRLITIANMLSGDSEQKDSAALSQAMVQKEAFT